MDTDEEIWKKLDGWEYEVSNQGRVRRVRRAAAHGRGKPALSQKDINGYRQVGLYRNAKQSYVMVHRLVLEVFVGPAPSDKHQGNHKNGKKADNRVENLEWVTQRENQLHAYRTGLQSADWDYAHSKLSAEQRKEIRSRYAAGGVSQVQLAKDYGITQGHVSWILRQGKRIGAEHGRARLTEALVAKIRETYTGAKGEQTEIARRFGVSKGTVSKIVCGKNWKHLGGRVAKTASVQAQRGATLSLEQREAMLAEYRGRKYGEAARLARKYGVPRSVVYRAVNAVR